MSGSASRDGRCVVRAVAMALARKARRPGGHVAAGGRSLTRPPDPAGVGERQDRSGCPDARPDCPGNLAVPGPARHVPAILDIMTAPPDRDVPDGAPQAEGDGPGGGARRGSRSGVAGGPGRSRRRGGSVGDRPEPDPRHGRHVVTDRTHRVTAASTVISAGSMKDTGPRYRQPGQPAGPGGCWMPVVPRRDRRWTGTRSAAG
jgi:hypothetical protein